MQFLLVQMLYDFPDVLRVLPGGNQQSIWSLDHHQIAPSHHSDKLARCMHVVAPRIQNEHAGSGDDVAIGCATLGSVMLMQCCPRAQIVPAEIGGQAENIPLPLAFGRARLENCVVDANVLAFRILPAKRGCKLSRAESSGDFFEQECGPGKMLPQRIGECTGAPQKHAAVPKIVPCLHEIRGLLRIRFLGEAADAKSFALKCASRFDIAIAGFRAIRPDAKHDDVLACSRDLSATLLSLPKSLFRCDY